MDKLSKSKMVKNPGERTFKIIYPSRHFYCTEPKAISPDVAEVATFLPQEED